jgi:hypothetical protein
VKWWRPALLLPLVPAIVWAQEEIDARLGSFRVQDEAKYLWSGAEVKRLVPGFEGLMASVYWLRTVQYFGGQQAFAREKNFDLLYPLIEITTTLDPRLEIAYRYGAVFLCEPPPVGAGRPKEGIAVLERGARALPQSWRLRQDLGFFHYLFLDDAEKASQILNEAADIPGAAFWLRNLAADVLDWGGNRQKSRLMWRRMFEQAEEGIIKENARVRLEVIDAQDEADQWTQRVSSFERRFGRRPVRIEELQTAGLWPGPPVDQTGVPFDYDPGTGRVRVSEHSTLWRPERGKKWKPPSEPRS